MSITAKLVNGSQKTVDVPDMSITIAELKKLLTPEVEIPADEQRIILRGKVLKDEDIMSAVGMENGTALHVVRSKKKADAPQPTPVAASSAVTQAALAPTATPSTGAEPSNPYASLFGGYGAPQAGGGGMGAPPPGFDMGALGMGGAGGMPGMGGYSPEAAMQMMQNPTMMQMAQQAMQNPEFMRMAMQSNPQLANMPPEAMQHAMQMMQNPEMMRQMMALSGAMGGAGGFGGAGAAPGGAGAMAPAPLGAAAQQPNFGGFPGMFAAPPQHQGDPREIYRDQLQQLRDMGFPNEEANIAALQQAQGSVSFALERLLNS